MRIWRRHQSGCFWPWCSANTGQARNPAPCGVSRRSVRRQLHRWSDGAGRARPVQDRRACRGRESGCATGTGPADPQPRFARGAVPTEPSGLSHERSRRLGRGAGPCRVRPAAQRPVPWNHGLGSCAYARVALWLGHVGAPLQGNLLIDDAVLDRLPRLHLGVGRRWNDRRAGGSSGCSGSASRFASGRGGKPSE